MVDLVTLDQVNLALKLDLTQSGSPAEFTDARTPDVELKITQAQAAILGYLKVDADEWTAETVPAEVTAAIILGVKGLYDGNDALLAGLYDNERTNPIVGLLQRRRDPALA
jgi:hypothetical protein